MKTLMFLLLITISASANRYSYYDSPNNTDSWPVIKYLQCSFKNGVTLEPSSVSVESEFMFPVVSKYGFFSRSFYASLSPMHIAGEMTDTVRTLTLAEDQKGRDAKFSIYFPVQINSKRLQRGLKAAMYPIRNSGFERYWNEDSHDRREGTCNITLK